MKIIKSILILVFLLLQVMSVKAQGTEIDDLKSKLDNATQDTTRLKLLIELSSQLFSTSPDEVVQYCNEALRIARELDLKSEEALALKNLGLALYFKGDFVEAVRIWENTLELYEAQNNQVGVANILSNLGAVYDYQGDYAKSIELYLRSLDIAHEINDTIREITVLNNLGLSYSKKPETVTLAIDYYLKALDLSKQKEYTEGIGSASLNIGEYYYNQADYSTALEYFETSQDAFQQINSMNLTSSLIYLGKIYVTLGDYEIALKYQSESYEYAKRAGAKYEMLVSLLALAETYQRMGNLDRSIELNEISLEIAKEISTNSERMIALKNLSAVYEELKDYQKAYNFLLRALVLNDTILLETNQDKINKLRVQYEIENMLLEVDILKQKNELNEIRNKQQRIVIFLFVLGFFVTLIFAILLFRMFRQKRKANLILEEQNILITGQKQEITDSIKYASRIQSAVLTPQDDISRLLPEHFILYRPRDIVSGDFYWITEIKNRVMCVVADCTGHGVPGAFMSMLGVAFLNEIISRNPDIPAGDMLNQLRAHVIDSLHQKNIMSGSQDGMDLVAVIIDKEKSVIQYAGANNPLFFFRNSELIEFKADKMPIGIHEKLMQSFTNHEIPFKKNDTFYAFSDGFPDQFGGPSGKKFMIKNFKAALSNLHEIPMRQQKAKLEEILDDWMKNVNQVDDILVMGVRL